MSEQPVVIVIFGATGDLAGRKLLPALFHLAASRRLPSRYRIIAVARREFDHESYAELAHTQVSRYYRHDVNHQDWQQFAANLQYVRLDFEQPADFDRLRQAISAEAGQDWSSRRLLLYLATNPTALPLILEQLSRTGLSKRPRSRQGWTRVILEKPFGQDLTSARRLNRLVTSHLQEEQVYRIDHYLGKETVQNIMAFRFANGLFERCWNAGHIDHMQITVAETLGVESRGEYYDQTGALRDVVQNHAFQLLSLIAMEEPLSLDAEDIRDAKVAVLSRLDIARSLLQSTVAGQYQAGRIDGRSVPGYRQEPNVSPRSQTETFVALKLGLDGKQWQGVPFYIRTGKRLQQRLTEIHVVFKQPLGQLFDQLSPVRQNILTFRIQPDEGIALQVLAKQPGSKLDLLPVALDFSYRQQFEDQPEAYERLILDAVGGDPTLFLRSDEVEEGWRYVTKVLNAWEDGQFRPKPYQAGSWGPSAAEALLAKDGRSWLTR